MAPQLRTETVSIAAWVKRVDTTPPGGGWRVVVSYGEQGHVLSFQHALAPLGGLQMTGRCEFSATQTVLDDDWHHLAMTRSLDGTIRVYLDGEPQPLIPGDDLPSSAEPNTTPTCAVAPAFGDSVWIGGDPGHSEYFHGSIDDVRIYSGVLTYDEIAMLATDTP